jgi:phosphatidate cytidylyltransferase
MVNQLSTSSKNTMLTRVLTGIVLLGFLLPCTAFGNWAFFVLMALLSVIGISEIVRAPGPNRYGLFTKTVVYVFVLSFIFWVFIKNWIDRDNPFTGTGFYLTDIFVSVLGIILYALILFLIAIITPKVQLSDVTYLFTIGIIFALGFQGMFFLRYFPNASGIVKNGSVEITPSWQDGTVKLSDYFSAYYQAHGLNQTFNSCLLFIYMLIGTWGSDVGAYFFGMFFGKHRMNPRISPHKTWEGFFGGMVVSVGASLGFAAVAEYCFHSPLVPGLVQFSDSDLLAGIGVLKGTAWPFLVSMSVLMPIVGNVGGFLYSLVKRQFGLKDFGRIFPGHGGVIDRFDSIMINSIVMSIIILLTANGWNFLI